MPVKIDSNITITIKRDTHSKLDKIGKRKESYDEIIVRLINFFEEHGGE
jgi:predicted CopG family antitoxin